MIYAMYLNLKSSILELFPFIPVKTLGAQTEVNGDLGAFGSAGSDDGSTQYDVETAAVDGGIHHVVVTNGGAGYTNGTYNNVAVVGDGSGATVTVKVAGGAVTSAVMLELVLKVGKTYSRIGGEGGLGNVGLGVV